MRIKYTIYWFENDLGRLNRRKTMEGINNVQKFLANQGFDSKIIFYINTKEIPKRFFNIHKLDAILLDDYTHEHLNTIDFANVDLVVMDYHLGTEEESGDKIIAYIRAEKSEIFTDVLFYSENGSETDLRRIADRDGLYCSNWNDIFSGEKITKIIKTLIRKNQDLNNLRGLVMAETSELDEMMKKILELVGAKYKLNKTIQDSKCSACKEPKKVIFFHKTEQIFEFKGTASLEKSIKECLSYDLYKQVKTYLKSSLYTGSLNINDYDEDIRKHRNTLAHYPEESSTLSVMQIRQGNRIVDYDEAKFIKIRQDIQKYKEIFQSIIKELEH